MDDIYRQQIYIENSTDKGYQTKYYHQSANNAIDNHYSLLIPFLPDFIYKPCQSVPPQHSSSYDACIAHAHHERMIWRDKVEHAEQCHEQQNYKWIAECDEKSRPAVIPKRTLAVLAALMRIAERIVQHTVKSKGK